MIREGRPQVPGWLRDVLSSTAFSLVIGALLSGLIGIAAWWWQQRQTTKRTRRALGGLLYGELAQLDPESLTTLGDPPTARRLQLNALPLLLAPGVMNPWNETDLFLHLIFLSSVVDDFNDKARLYNDAWLQDEPPIKLQRCFNDLQMSAWDFSKAYDELMQMGFRLGPPLKLELTEEDVERLTNPTLLQRVQNSLKRWKIRRKAGDAWQ